ncbi:alpha-tectorin-like isoform X1 [Xiphophorus hellerii]|uniref:alpha-tectorin-like isoform X1 n=1 Tax=Xiphophorus hellerii TaxID=8084 RepID=UPI0013B36F76|nr:alpha-tectorin-like isoform X1 [Xiphophorus hellerii]
MLCLLLLFLSAAMLLPGAADQLAVFASNTEVDISSCPITYFGQKYEQLYLNFTSDNFVLCFTGFYEPQGRGDCLVAPQTDNTQFYLQSVPDYVELQNIVQNLPSIKNTGECYMFFMNSAYTFLLVNFGSQSAFMNVDQPVFTDFLVDGNKVFPPSVANQQAYADLSGCRSSGVLFRPGDVVSSDPITCRTLTCSQSAVLQKTSCGPTERCQGNGVCSSASSLGSVCTVTGPAVVDFQGQQNSVKDRCWYSLLRIPSGPDFQVLAHFQERRRKDVSFLDGVTLRLNGFTSAVDIQLKQGGRVLLNGSPLTLSGSVQTGHGVNLSKDQTGVTVQASLSDFSASVFFDGSTAQIHLKGSYGLPLQGLCGNASRSLSEERLSEDGSTSCEAQYTDATDTTTSCTKMAERCSLLKEAPFSSCGVDPEPYMAACTDTLCRYPDLDGLSCRFLEAYARACSLQSSAAPEDWRSKAQCSPPGAVCQDRTCSDHEFCGEKTAGGETRCFCRAIFASKYRQTNSLGDPPVCRQSSTSLSLVGCLLEDKGIDYSDLQLKDPTCRGQMDQQTHMVTFSFNSTDLCGTEVTTHNSQTIYKNTIMTQNLSSGGITRQDQVYIGFSCVETQPDIQTVAFRIKDSSVVQFISSGLWNYSLTMKAYTDAHRTKAVASNTKVRLNQKIWVELDANGLNESLVALVMDSCWATDKESANASRKHYLIKNGCPNPEDQTVSMEANGKGTSNSFSFNMFQFIGSSAEVYLHCKLQLCIKQENTCVKTCGGTRRRRSVRSQSGAAAFISMAWTA